MGEPILLNQHEDSNLKSILGVDGTNTGATFEAGKFGNCARIDADAEYVVFNNHVVDLNECIFGIWLNTDWNLVNGHPSDGVQHDLFAVETVAGADKFRLIFHPNATYDIVINRAGINTNCRDLSSNWNSGTWNYILIVLSRSANFDATKTLAIYINGLQTASSTEALADIGSVAVNTYVGAYKSGIVPIDGMIDQLVVYNNVSAELLSMINARRFDERGGLNDMAVIM